ncbi:MAG: hypothetical protein SFW66_04580 [Gammaproteobacteria bacterium]|nr:hypothetical protein [Gammaproteobacteria bacterium]
MKGNASAKTPLVSIEPDRIIGKWISEKSWLQPSFFYTPKTLEVNKDNENFEFKFSSLNNSTFIYIPINIVEKNFSHNKMVLGSNEYGVYIENKIPENPCQRIFLKFDNSQCPQLKSVRIALGNSLQEEHEQFVCHNMVSQSAADRAEIQRKFKF